MFCQDIKHFSCYHSYLTHSQCSSAVTITMKNCFRLFQAKLTKILGHNIAADYWSLGILVFEGLFDVFQTNKLNFSC